MVVWSYEGETMAISFAIFPAQEGFSQLNRPYIWQWWVNRRVKTSFHKWHKWHVFLGSLSEENADMYFRYFTSLVVSKWQLFCFIAHDLDLFPYFGFLFSFRLDMSLTWRHKDCVSMKLAPNWSEIQNLTWLCFVTRKEVAQNPSICWVDSSICRPIAAECGSAGFLPNGLWCQAFGGVCLG